MKTAKGYWIPDPILELECPYCKNDQSTNPVIEDLTDDEEFKGTLTCTDCGKKFKAIIE